MKVLHFENGDTFPQIGLGTWKSAPGEVGQAVLEALKAGIRHIDCAAIYGNEKEIGLALQEAFSSGLVTREEVFITSKLWNNAHHFESVIPALKQTLSDLQLEYLDLYLIHWPVAHQPHAVNPREAADFISLEELPLLVTWEGMIKAQEAGLTRHIGVSNFSVRKLTQLVVNSRYKPEVNQVEMHPLLTQVPLMEFCQKHEIILTAYSPLGSRDRKMENAPDLFALPEVQELATNHQCTPAQVLIAWAVNRGTSVIPKSVTPSRMSENLAAQDITFSFDEMQLLNRLNRDFRFIDGSFWVKEGNGYTLEGLWN
jgi:alcohol dehydrogenase (NADP+)